MVESLRWAAYSVCVLAETSASKARHAEPANRSRLPRRSMGPRCEPYARVIGTRVPEPRTVA